jgi:cell wall-associated NlpC family hydrolase
VRLRTLFVALCSILTVAACTAASALASTSGSASVAGGAASSSTTTSTKTSTSVAGGAAPTATSPAKPAKPGHYAPITAKTSNVAYSGPVYEKTATGQLVPYTPAPASTPAQLGNATASSATGAATTGISVTGGAPTGTGLATTSTAKPELLVPGHIARLIDGLAAAPMDAPATVQQIIWAGNQIVGLPYIYGGGHASFVSPGYDCSGTVSYALHGASLLETPMDSTEFEGWGSQGVGTWVTIFANGGHAYMTVAGLRLDTSPANDPSNLPGPRWRPLRPENAGFVIRHPLGL